jgi:hypothetical protein
MNEYETNDIDTLTKFLFELKIICENRFTESLKTTNDKTDLWRNLVEHKNDFLFSSAFIIDKFTPENTSYFELAKIKEELLKNVITTFQEFSNRILPLVNPMIV